jgi:tRNA/rRNA methyltransferase
MECFGLTDWVCVSSEAHLKGMQSVLRHHREPAVWHAKVDAVTRVDTLRQAIADCSWVVGTTMRSIEGRPRYTLRELAEASAQRHDVTWALVFGPECNGLDNEAVEQCHAVSYIPSSDEQPSLNLSQAVVLYAHELASVHRPEIDPSSPALATDASFRALSAVMHQRLAACRFDRDPSERAKTVAALMSALLRASLSRNEAAAWTNAWRHFT